jgi:hypothetical protein
MADGPLRIVQQPRAFGEPTAEEKIKEYWQKLARIAPAEVTGFYLTFRPMVIGNLTADQIPKDFLAPWWPWICVGLVVFVRVWATHRDKWWRAQWKPVAIATIAFILWVITMGHYMAYLSDWVLLKDPRVSGILAAVFTFLAPYIYKGDPPPKPPPAANKTEEPAVRGSL